MLKLIVIPLIYFIIVLMLSVRCSALYNFLQELSMRQVDYQKIVKY